MNRTCITIVVLLVAALTSCQSSGSQPSRSYGDSEGTLNGCRFELRPREARTIDMEFEYASLAGDRLLIEITNTAQALTLTYEGGSTDLEAGPHTLTITTGAGKRPLIRFGQEMPVRALPSTHASPNPQLIGSETPYSRQQRDQSVELHFTVRNEAGGQQTGMLGLRPTP